MMKTTKRRPILKTPTTTTPTSGGNDEEDNGAASWHATASSSPSSVRGGNNNWAKCCMSTLMFAVLYSSVVLPQFLANRVLYFDHHHIGDVPQRTTAASTTTTTTTPASRQAPSSLSTAARSTQRATESHQRVESAASLPPPTRSSDPLPVLRPTTSTVSSDHQEQHPSHVIFYHIFIPDDDTPDHALRIVAEQIGQVRQSFAARAMYEWLSHPSNPTILYYTIVGAAGALNRTHMQHLCTNQSSARRAPLDCRPLQHYPQGFEDKTLQALHEYCQNDDNGNKRVVYIHNKGSYHNHEDGTNERWRWHLTDAVTRRECLQPPNAGTGRQCNVCGLQFYPIWNTFFPGNFFTAQCDYVRRLISPEDFPSRLEQMVPQLSALHAQKRLLLNLYDHSLPFLDGVDRYAWEIWSGTHPSIMPCDFSKKADLIYWLKRPKGSLLLNHNGSTSPTDDDNDKGKEWNMAPRHKMKSKWMQLQRHRRQHVLAEASLRMRDYFLLPGNLAKWHALYGEAPPAHSWVWEWFPDGQTWKRAVLQQGPKEALRLLTEPYVQQSEPEVSVTK